MPICEKAARGPSSSSDPNLRIHPGLRRDRYCLYVVAWVLGLGLGLVAMLGGVATVGIGRRSRENRLESSRLIGVRTPTTRRHPEAWSAAQLAAGPMEIVAGSILATGGVGALVFLPFNRTTSIALSLFALLAALAFGVVAFYIGARAGRLAASQLNPGPR